MTESWNMKVEFTDRMEVLPKNFKGHACDVIYRRDWIRLILRTIFTPWRLRCGRCHKIHWPQRHTALCRAITARTDAMARADDERIFKRAMKGVNSVFPKP